LRGFKFEDHTEDLELKKSANSKTLNVKTIKQEDGEIKITDALIAKDKQSNEKINESLKKTNSDNKFKNS
jgi:hypothetical protein